MGVISFFFLVFVLISGLYYFAFTGAALIFNFQSHNLYYPALWLGLALTLGFIVFSLLVRRHSNWVLTLGYALTAAWIGFLVYLVFAGLLGRLLLLTAGGLKLNLKMAYLLARFFYLLALVVTIYGIINARQLKVTRLDILVKNLSPAWNGKTIAHLSDLHLGAINGLKFANQIIDLTNSLNPDLVAITGDYFDGTCPDLKSLAEPLSRLRADRVLFVFGNHEIYAGAAETTAALEDTPVQLLRDEIVTVDGLNFIGLDYPVVGQAPNSAILNQVPADQPTVLLFHEPRLINEAKQAGVNLMLSGHTHRGQLFPFNIFTRLIYGPYHYGLRQEGDFSIYTSSGTGSWGPPLKIVSRPEIILIKLIQS